MLSVSSIIGPMLCVWLAWLTYAHGQGFAPMISCPQYFKYVMCQNQICGLLTLPPIRARLNVLHLRVLFTVPKFLDVDEWGKLSPLLDDTTTINNFQNGISVQYRIDFPSQDVPKIRGLSINDQVIDACSSSKYPRPKSDFQLEHIIRSRGSSLGSLDLLESINNLNNNNGNRGDSGNSFMTLAPMRPTGSFDADIGAILRQPDSSWPSQTSNAPQQQQRPMFMPQQPQMVQRPTSTEFFTQPTPRVRRPVVQQQPSSVEPPAQRININNIDNNNNNNNNNNNRRTIDYSECGVEGTEGLLPFIQEGTILTRGQFPWLTAIYKKESTGINLICGGSLISTRSVLTAAHCFKVNSLIASQLLVYLGRHDLGNYEDIQVHDIQTLVAHPDFNTVLLPDADIALLQLRKTVEYNLYIRPICLWSEPDDLKLMEGVQGTVAGWGADEAGNLVSTLPKKAFSTIVSRDQCSNSSDTYKRLLTERSFCAGDRDGSGPCKGDSGGSLMVKRDDRWTIRGIVTGGHTIKEQCNLQHYVIYCDAAKHMEWVRQNMLN